MCNLSKRELEVLRGLKTSMPDVVAGKLGISPKSVATYKSRVKRKEYKARKFLEVLKEFKDVLQAEKKYKNVKVSPAESEEE